MAYFKAKDLKLGTNQSIYFGDSDQARLWFDGTEWAATHTISGTAATEGHHLIRKDQVDAAIATLSGSIVIDHGALTGLGDDDHTQYVPTDGSRGFTATVSGIDPVLSSDLATKNYIDTELATISGGIVQDHGSLTGLGDDDHTQYSLVDGSRAFTGTVGGITPVASTDLTTKAYVDALVNGLDWQDSVLSKSYSSPPPASGTERYIVSPTASGSWVGQDNNIAEYNGSGWDITSVSEGMATWVEDEDVLYVFNGTQWVKFGATVTHANLLGLASDDHTQYILEDGTRDFSGKVSYSSHPTFTTDEELVDKKYVDDEIATLSGSIVLDHGALTGLADDDHLQYVPTDGSRGFTATVSGIDPTQDYDLATKSYVDSVSVDKVQSGRTTLADNDETKSVTFGTAFADTNYSISVILSNTVDSDPGIYPMVVSAKATTGFTVIFSGKIDSANYVLEWIARHD